MASPCVSLPVVEEDGVKGTWASSYLTYTNYITSHHIRASKQTRQTERGKKYYLKVPSNFLLDYKSSIFTLLPHQPSTSPRYSKSNPLHISSSHRRASIQQCKNLTNINSHIQIDPLNQHNTKPHFPSLFHYSLLPLLSTLNFQNPEPRIQIPDSRIPKSRTKIPNVLEDPRWFTFHISQPTPRKSNMQELVSAAESICLTITTTTEEIAAVKKWEKGKKKIPQRSFGEAASDLHWGGSETLQMRRDLWDVRVVWSMMMMMQL